VKLKEPILKPAAGEFFDLKKILRKHEIDNIKEV
jgi:hypothetical protein